MKSSASVSGYTQHSLCLPALRTNACRVLTMSVVDLTFSYHSSETYTLKVPSINTAPHHKANSYSYTRQVFSLKLTKRNRNTQSLISHGRPQSQCLQRNMARLQSRRPPSRRPPR